MMPRSFRCLKTAFVFGLRRKGAEQEPESRGPLSGAHRTMLMPLRQGKRCPRPTSLAISEYWQRKVGNMLQGASPARRKLIDSAPRGIAWRRSAREFGWMPPVWRHSDELWLAEEAGRGGAFC